MTNYSTDRTNEEDSIERVKGRNIDDRYKDTPVHSIWKNTAEQQLKYIKQQTAKIQELNKENEAVKYEYQGIFLKYVRLLEDYEITLKELETIKSKST